ncbi:hypothetical protein B0T21DRAFT_411393 [Apiosordaria backusii]|uniref:Uncharacterized protein n=1 Tax=Apiosordaria backusii TaxID=314023 RepID=A0AA40EDS2_9PEZI|nr:hypothetical protein B0T21DRAFT_411393 [Apiosordaria backusii]
MESTMDAAQLVAQMQETLSTIHTTLASLNTAEHDAKLDELEARRDSTIKHLLAAYSLESQVLHHRRLAEREEIAERRRIEDEERERRRRQEDAELEERNKQEDEARDGMLLHETNEVEDETDHLMLEVEKDAQRVIDEGQKKLMDLEERREELNRLIGEQLRAPTMPSPPKRSRRGSNMPPVVATQNKLPEPVAPQSPNSTANALEPQNTSTDRHDEIAETISQSQTMPQADMTEDPSLNTDASNQKQVSPTDDSKPTSREDLPLFVQPVISRSGAIIHADHLQQKAPTPAESIGIPTRDTDSFATPQTPETAQHAIEPENVAQSTDGVHAMPQLSHKVDEPLSNQTPWGMGDNITAATVEVTSLPLSHAGGVTSNSAPEYDMPSPNHHIEAPAQAEQTLPPQNLDVLKNDPSPSSADIPRPLTATDDTFYSAAVTPFATANEQPATLPSALSDHSRSHSGDHVSFVAGKNQDISRHDYFGLIQASGTPERQGFEPSAGGDAVSSVSRQDQTNTEHETTPIEPPKIVLPLDMDGSCSLTDVSEYCPPEAHPEMMSHSHRPALIHSESYTGDEGEDVEVEIPLQRVVSHQRPVGEACNEAEEDAQAGQNEQAEPEAHVQSEPGPESEAQELEEEHLHTPALQTIPECEVLENMAGETAEPRLDQQPIGLGIHVEADIDGPVPEHEHDAHHDTDATHDEDIPGLSSSSDHADQYQSFYDDDSHSEDEYAQPKPITPNPLILQSFRTSGSGDYGSSVGDRDVPKLADDVSRHGEGDAEPGVSGGQPGAQADLGVLRESGHVGHGGEEGAQEEAQESLTSARDDVHHGTPLPSGGLKKEESLVDQLRRASQVSNESVEMEAGHTTTVNGEGDLFDDEDAESDYVSDIQDAYLNEEGVVDATVAAMGPVAENTEDTPAEVPTDQVPVDFPVGAPADASFEAQVKTTLETPVLMAAEVETDAHTKALDQIPGTASDHEVPVSVPDEALLEMQAGMGTPESMPAVSTSVPTVEVQEPDHPARNANWVSEADDYFNERDDKEHVRQETAAQSYFEQQTALNTAAVTSDSRPGTPSFTASQGLSASRHKPDRPQTPDRDTEFAHRDSPTLEHSQEEHQSPPQSMRSQSTLDSAPPSPDQHTATDIHDPVIRGLVSTHSPSYQTGRPRNDSHLTEYGHHRDESADTPLAKWQHRESTLSMPDPHIAALNTTRDSKHSHTGSEGGEKGTSLFQRMRNVFEQQTHASDINTSRSSTSRPISSTSSSHSNSDKHGGGGGGGGGSGLWGSGGPLSGRFGKSWAASDHHKDYHHLPYDGSGPGIVQRRKPFEHGDDDDEDEKDEDEEEVTFPLRAPIVLRDNFDRLHVISVRAQVSVDDVPDSSASSFSSTAGTSADPRFSWASSIPSSCVPLSVATSATTADTVDEEDDGDSVGVIGTKKSLRRSLALSPSSSVRKQKNTCSEEVEHGSDLRLPWLWVQGWRARLQKAGDEVERVRWEGRVESHFDRGGGPARRRQGCREKNVEEKHDVVVKKLPVGVSRARTGVLVNGEESVSVVEVGGDGNTVAKRGRSKSVHWA